MTLRPIRAYREINRDLGELREARRTEDEVARLELTRRAHVFTKRSRKVVDETMNLSAVLMRAGEVDEATRLLAEVDREVETEKAALLESVNEVRSREVVTRHKMSRLRMAKMLLTAVLGASLMMFSAFGFALAKFLAPAPAQGAQNRVMTTHDAPKGERSALNNIKHIHFAGMKIALTPEQMAEYERLTASGAGDDELQEFLRKVLSSDLAKQIVAAAAPVTDAAEDLLADAKKTVKTQSTSTSPQEKESSKKTKEDPDEGSAGGDGENGGENDEKRCKDDSGEGEDETTLGAPGPGCIPVVNEESPI